MSAVGQNLCDIGIWVILPVHVFFGSKAHFIIDRYHIFICILPDHFCEPYYSHVKDYSHGISHSNTDDEFEQHLKAALWNISRFSNSNGK